MLVFVLSPLRKDDNSVTFGRFYTSKVLYIFAATFHAQNQNRSLTSSECTA
jgi:hypothetical protein